MIGSILVTVRVRSLLLNKLLVTANAYHSVSNNMRCVVPVFAGLSCCLRGYPCEAIPQIGRGLVRTMLVLFIACILACDRVKPIQQTKATVSSDTLVHAKVSEPDSLAAALKQPDEVVIMRLYCKDEPVDPTVFSRFVNMEELYVYGDCNIDFSELFVALADLRKLKEVDLTVPHLTQLPPSIGMLRYVKHVEISYGAMTHLPKEIGRLTQLQVLRILRNRLSSLPDSLAALHSLRELDVMGNRLRTLPAGFSALSNLEELNITKNPNIDLKQLFDILGEMKGLRRLDIRGCKITTLPDNIHKLQSLEQLDLGENRIRRLPSTFQQLKNLRSVRLRFNPINLQNKDTLNHWKLLMPDCQFYIDSYERPSDKRTKKS